MPMHYRNRIEIVSAILEAAANNDRGSLGTTKTRIRYKAFLGYTQLREYVEMLVENDLLVCNLDSQTFNVTEKGHNFLQTYNQIEEPMV
jgi:predicted transcriptional regulator